MDELTRPKNYYNFFNKNSWTNLYKMFLISIQLNSSNYLTSLCPYDSFNSIIKNIFLSSKHYQEIFLILYVPIWWNLFCILLILYLRMYVHKFFKIQFLTICLLIHFAFFSFMTFSSWVRTSQTSIKQTQELKCF